MDQGDRLVGRGEALGAVRIPDADSIAAPHLNPGLVARSFREEGQAVDRLLLERRVELGLAGVESDEPTLQQRLLGLALTREDDEAIAQTSDQHEQHDGARDDHVPVGPEELRVPRPPVEAHGQGRGLHLHGGAGGLEQQLTRVVTGVTAVERELELHVLGGGHDRRRLQHHHPVREPGEGEGDGLGRGRVTGLEVDADGLGFPGPHRSEIDLVLRGGDLRHAAGELHREGGRHDGQVALGRREGDLATVGAGLHGVREDHRTDGITRSGEVRTGEVGTGRELPARLELDRVAGTREGERGPRFRGLAHRQVAELELLLVHGHEDADALADLVADLREGVLRGVVDLGAELGADLLQCRFAGFRQRDHVDRDA